MAEPLSRKVLEAYFISITKIGSDGKGEQVLNTGGLSPYPPPLPHPGCYVPSSSHHRSNKNGHLRNYNSEYPCSWFYNFFCCHTSSTTTVQFPIKDTPKKGKPLYKG